MANNLDLIVKGFTDYIVTPVNAFGLGGFVFDIEGETTVNLATEITDHYVETNEAMQDHIAIKPKKVTLKSYVGELVFRQDENSDTIVQKAVQKLTTLSEFLPQLADGATQFVDFIDQAREGDISLDSISLDSVNKIADYWSLVKNMAGFDSRQQQAYMYFKALLEQKILVSVQTPFEFIPRMALESVVAIQDETTATMCDFAITLKQINIAETKSVAFGELKEGDNASVPQYQNRAGLQSEPLTNGGNMLGSAPEAPFPPTPDALIKALNETVGRAIQ